MKKINWGILGIGEIAQKFAEGFYEAPNAKLLEKQKKGKARSKQFGRVEIPQEAFIGVLKISKEK